MNNTEIAKSVIEAIGGKDNVSSVAHCATRLRIMVKEALCQIVLMKKFRKGLSN